MKVRHVNHVGIVVNDLEVAKDFFIELGFTVAGETKVEGKWVGRIVGLDDVRSDVVMLKAPDGQLHIELSKFHQPTAIVQGNGQPETSNMLGLRHIAFEVDDLEGIVETLKYKGIELVGEIETYGNSWKLCYIRGPEGIFIELAEQLS